MRLIDHTFHQLGDHYEILIEDETTYQGYSVQYKFFRDEQNNLCVSPFVSGPPGPRPPKVKDLNF